MVERLLKMATNNLQGDSGIFNNIVSMIKNNFGITVSKRCCNTSSVIELSRNRYRISKVFVNDYSIPVCVS